MEVDIRPRSRQTSSNSTVYSTNSDRWPMNRQRAGAAWTTSASGGSRTSSRTSIWSDEGATIAAPRGGQDAKDDLSMLVEAGERPLIELESTAGDLVGGESVDMGGSSHIEDGVGAEQQEEEEEEEEEEMTPAEKLKALLREMNSEVKETRASSPIKRACALPPSSRAAENGTERRGMERDLLDDFSSAGGSDAGAGAGAVGLGVSTGRRSAWRDRRIGSGGSRTTRSDDMEQDPMERQEAGPSSPRRRSRAAPAEERGYDEDEEEDDSPPTPPPRITNPYLYNRKPARQSPTPPPAAATAMSPPRREERRVPTRVEVLNASASRSPPPPKSPSRERSALESFIASHPGPSHSHTSNGHHLRSSISSQGSSRKGKERAPAISHSSPIAAGMNSHRSRTPSATSSIHEYTGTPISKTPRPRAGVAVSTAFAGRTPKRYDIEDPPEDEDDFAAALEGLEVPGEVELDIDEGMSSRLEMMQALESESEVESNPPEASSSRARDIAVGASPARSSRPPTSRDTTLQAPRTRHSRGPSEESLPALPEPDASESEEDSRVHTLSSRRASLFRGSSKSPRVSLSPQPNPGPHTPPTSAPAAPRPASQSPFKLSPAHTSAYAAHSQSHERMGSSYLQTTLPRTKGSPARLSINDEDREPREEVEEDEEQAEAEGDDSWRDAASSFARPPSSSSSAVAPPARHPQLPSTKSTPQRWTANTTLSGQPTPHPPGFLSVTPVKQGVRFSPLSKHDGEWSVSLASEEQESAVHRLKVSPIRHRPASASLSAAGIRSRDNGDEAEEANTSFTARLSALGRSLIRPPPSTILPPPSKTLGAATASLGAAAKRTEEAASRLSQSQTAFISALSTFGASSSSAVVVGAAKQGWRWTTYAYWIALELLLCWAVFRVTLDYAAQVYPHDPWSLYGTARGVGQGAMAIPPHSGLSGFVVRHDKGGANFFDLLEKLELWRRLEDLGWTRTEERRWMEELRMLGGVPT